jgi:hypothetical protein
VRVRFPLLALGAALCGCASPMAMLRASAARHATLAVRTGPPVALGPEAPTLVVNPAECLHVLEAGGSCSGDSTGFCALFILALTAACAGVVTVVDVAALPIQLSVRRRQGGEIERIVAACRLDDPAPVIADAFAARLEADHGFSRATIGTEDGHPADAIVLEVATDAYTRAKALRWRGTVRLRSADGATLWERECGASAAERAVEGFLADCEGARGDLAALASRCEAEIATAFRIAWGAATPPPAAPTPSPAAAPAAAPPLSPPMVGGAP